MVFKTQPIKESSLGNKMKRKRNRTKSKKGSQGVR